MIRHKSDVILSGSSRVFSESRHHFLVARARGEEKKTAVVVRFQEALLSESKFVFSNSQVSQLLPLMLGLRETQVHQHRYAFVGLTSISLARVNPVLMSRNCTANSNLKDDDFHIEIYSNYAYLCSGSCVTIIACSLNPYRNK